MLAASQPFSLILFGASGHLARLKIYPALYTLALKKRFPKNYAIVGYARTDLDDASFRTLVAEAVRENMPEVTEKALTEFLSHLHFQRGQYDQIGDFEALRKRLDTIEKGWESPVRVGYLSVPPTVFTTVLEHLCASGVRLPGGHFRCVVEKPVGNDFASYQTIANALQRCFDPSEIYLLDHYLGKEAVRNIYYLRHANPVLERLFKNTLIHHVEVVADEVAGLDGRAGYFEQTGTFRDWFQSHLVQLCALITMRLHDDSFQESRLHALQQLYLPPAASLDEIALQGQYAAGTFKGNPVPGYREEQNVSADSRTNTFAVLKLMSRTSRWQGVPFYLRSGKRLEKKETRISIQFQVSHPVGKGSYPNRLDIILLGEGGMRLHLQTKLGGAEPEFRPLILEDPLVCVGDCLPEHGILLLEAVAGRTQWFLTFEEVASSWRLLDPVQAHFDKPSTALHLYSAGSRGPDGMEPWMQRDGNVWMV